MIHWNREKPRERRRVFLLGPHLPLPNSPRLNPAVPFTWQVSFLHILALPPWPYREHPMATRPRRVVYFFPKWVLWFHRCLPHEIFISIVEFASIRSWQLNKIGLFFPIWGVTWHVQTHGISKSSSRSGSFRALAVLATAWLWNSYLKIVSIPNNIIFQCS